MTANPNDLVITGWGVVSPIGIGPEPFWDSLANGRGAVRMVEPVESINGRRWMAGIVEGFEAKQFVQPRKSLKVMCIETQMAFASSVLACKWANIESGKIDSDRLGTVFGSEMLFSEVDDIEEIVNLCRSGETMHHLKWGEQAMSNMYPLWMLKSLPNMPACHIGIWLDARGPNNTLTTEETSGLSALIEAAHVIRRGQADCMLVGAAGNRISLTRYFQRFESHLSTAYAAPEAACKPFDARRDGKVTGMGAATVVLERRSHAEARGAKPIAELVSWSSTFGRPTSHAAGSGDAVARSLDQVLKRGNIGRNEIDHVNASANGIITMDANEAMGIAKSLGETPVVSIKGYIGDSGCSSGLIELCASLAGSEHKLVPATINHASTADDCPVNVVKNQPKDWAKPYFIKTSMTPYGQSASVLLRVENG
jgi:3-oxoacyl-[acyl-carrier-protein] synthase II